MNAQMKRRGFNTAILILIVCIILAVGSTFSLFTSKDDVTIDVNSATVDVIANLVDLKAKSIGDTDYKTPAEGENTVVFGNAGTSASITTVENDDVLTVTNIAPGDEVKATIKITNNSTIAIAYRFKVNVTYTENAEGKTLKDALVISLKQNEKDLPLDVEYTQWYYQSVEGEVILPVDVFIDLPIEVGNDYQGLGATISFTVEAIQSNGVGNITNEFDSTQYVFDDKGLEKAFANGGKVVLMDNVVGSFVVPKGKVVDLYLNGKTITANSGDAITNNGTLTINDKYVAPAPTAYAGSAVVAASATESYFINNKGTLTINGGSFAATGYDAIVYAAEGSETVIADGSFTANEGAMLLAGEGNVVVNGGQFKSADDEAFSDSVTVNKGVFNFDVTEWLAADLAVGENDGSFVVLPVLPDAGEDVKYTYDEKSGLYYNGKATFGTYYIFDKADLLKAVAYFGGFTGEGNICTIELMADIDFAGEEWTPWSVMWITFNGNDHTISNLTTANAWRAGFFGYAGAVTVNDLTLENVVANGAQAGTLVGAAEAVTANNCTIKGENVVNYVEYVTDSYREVSAGVGAVVGITINSTINVTIAEGATVTVNQGILLSDCDFVDEYVGYLQANKGTITDNGTVTFNGINYKYAAPGVGIKDGNYYICNEEGYMWVEAQTDKFFGNKTIYLAANIDFGGKTINSIGFWNSHPTFDGQGYTLSNLVIGQSGLNGSSGLFAGTFNVKNLNVDNAKVSGTYAGVISGWIYGNVDGCTVKNSEAVSTYWQGGGLVGQFNSGNVTNCTVENCTVTGGAAIGGLIGILNEASGVRKVENCTVKNTAIVQNGGFGGAYDEMFGIAVGLINLENSTIYFNDITLVNNTLNGVASSLLYGLGEEGNTVYIDGFASVADGVSLNDGVYYISNANGLAWMEEQTAGFFNGKTVKLANDIGGVAGVTVQDGMTFDGNGYALTYVGIEYTYHLVKIGTGATLQNITLNNYRVRTENATSGIVTLTDVTVNMDNDLTGLNFVNGSGKVVLNNVTCKGTKDAAHLDPNTKVQVDYTPYGDVVLGGRWALEANDCDFGSLHGWNTTNGSNVYLNNTTYTVFRMHYWSGRTLYIDGVETAWSESGAIPVAHDVGGCWSVQPAFK